MSQAPSFVPTHTKSPSSPKVQVYFAIVLHDFVAERADELDAKAGDAISVVAQSNREWFVAKPIGRLGRPGLIPVTFVEIRDPTTGQPVQDVNALIDSGALPKVEEWKKAVMNYKANSITLGVLDEAPTPLPQSAFSPTSIVSAGPPISVQAPTPNYQTQQDPDPPSPEAPRSLPEGILLSADVKSFHYEMEEYWFRLHAIFQPYPFSSSQSLPPAKQLVLFRSYNDFYDFQVDMLDAFPTEGGRPDRDTRILPYMPGPVDHVDNEVTITRRQELDDYLHQLCELRFSARYILEDRLVREFLALRPGDAEADIEPRATEIETLARPPASERTREVDYESSVRDQLSQLNVSDRQDTGSEVSDYDEGAVQGRAYEGEAYDYRSNPQQYTSSTPQPPIQQALTTHQRAISSSSVQSKPKLTTRGLPGHSRSSSRTNSPLPNGKYSMDLDPRQSNGYSRSSLASSSHEPSPVSMRSSQSPSVATSATSASGRSRSQSNAAINSPPISASNPQTAFVKIKIFDRASDDLVAIRVHPKVTHSQLMDKVQARLGPNIQYLQFRDSLSHELVGLDNDEGLRGWLDSTERHVLYAE